MGKPGKSLIWRHGYWRCFTVASWRDDCTFLSLALFLFHTKKIILPIFFFSPKLIYIICVMFQGNLLKDICSTFLRIVPSTARRANLWRGNNSFEHVVYILHYVPKIFWFILRWEVMSFICMDFCAYGCTNTSLPPSHFPFLPSLSLSLPVCILISEINIKYLPQLFSYFLRQDISLNPDLINFDRLATQQTLWPFHFHSPGLGL